MSIVATITVPPSDFALAEAITANSSLRIRLERVIPIGNGFTPYFWASNHSIDTLERELEADPDISSFKVVDQAGEESLVRVRWDGLEGLLGIVSETGATVLDGVGKEGRWRLQLRFDDHEDLTAFYQRCSEEGVSVDLRRVHDLSDPRTTGIETALSEEQREALVLALTEGYFDVPRSINLVSLADRLGISDSAASQRIRRGITALLGDIPIEEDDD